MKRNIPLFIIDVSRAHGRARETDFVACTSAEFPWWGEITLVNEQELALDQDWSGRNPLCLFTDANPAGIRGKLKVVGAPGGLFVDNRNRATLQALMRRCLKEWRTRRATVAVNCDDVSPEAIVKFCDVLLGQTRENLRENPKDKQQYVVGSILQKIKEDYGEKDR